jgi:hypothetical protein
MRKLSIIIVALLVVGCGDEPQVFKYQKHVSFKPHTSAGEIFQHLPVTIYFPVSSNEIVTNITWDLGDNTTVKNATFVEHSFNNAASYKINVKVQTNVRLYNEDTTITVINNPPTFGAATASESALLLYPDGSGKFNMVYGLNTGASSTSCQLAKLKENLEVESNPVNLNMEVGTELGSELGRHATTADGKLALMAGSSLLLFNQSGERIRTTSIGRYPADLKAVDNKLVMVFDSAKYAVISSTDLDKNITTFQKRFVGVDDYSVYNYFLIDGSSLVVELRNPSNAITLLTSLNIGGSPGFSNYFPEPPFVKNMTQLSSGILVNSYLTRVDLKLLKLDASNNVQWRKSISYDGSPVLFESVPTRVIVKEAGGFTYVFFGNMRCVKLATNGDIIWDRFFYPRSARVDCVEKTSDGNFIMVGTSVDMVSTSYKYDIMMIKISPDGERIQ